MAQQAQAFDVLQVLDSVPLLSSLTKDEREKLAKGLERKELKEGDFLMKEGEDGDSFYIIVEGSVEVSTEKGGPVAVLAAGDYAGEQALLQNAKRNASLKATTKGVCLICKQKLFKKILAANKLVKFAKREAKRKAFVTTFDEDIKLDEAKDDKDPKVLTWLMECVSTNLLFANLNKDQTSRILKRMTLIDIKKGIEIITQGDTKATTFYVVESGAFDVLVDKVKIPLEYKRGGCFGELALLYDAPRAATVLATADSKCWEVDRKHFRYEVTVTAKKRVNNQLDFLRSVDLFKPLLSQELSYLSDALDECAYDVGSVIFKEGDAGVKFYIIKKGNVEWQKKSGEKGLLEAGTVFGERAIRTNQPRAATIVVKSQAIILEMGSKEFNELLGPVLDLVDDKIKGYQRSPEIQKQDKQNSDRRATAIKEEERQIALKKEARKKICKLADLQTIGVLGKGGFGLVTLVVDPNTKRSYALKSIRKYQVVQLELQKHIISEKKVMDMMYNKFLVNLNGTYKDKYRVYFLLDVCLGGELFTILRQRRYFNEPTARFYAACVIEGFDYMHKRDIIYRDLKPENLVLDSDGYLKIADFGFAKVCKDKTFTLCGTPDYLCPEIVTGQGHGKGVDWWTLGILIYEMLASFPPFVADDPIETYRKIIRGRIRFPRYFSQEVRDLIRGLLHNRPTRRLGVLRGGADNIRTHPWYQKFRWDLLMKGTMPAPIINKVKNIRDLSNFAQVEVDKDELKAIDPKFEFDQDF